MIYTQYKVEVEIPEEVWFKFGRKSEYDKMFIEAAKGNIGAGSSRYSEVYEWALFDIEELAIRCEEEFNNAIIFFEGKMKHES